MIYKAYRYRLYPTKEQKQVLAQHFGAVRFIYNWGLETKKKAWDESKETISWQTLGNQLTILKQEKPWLSDINRRSLETAIRNLDHAYKQFFKGKGFPRFKSKRGNRHSVAYTFTGYRVNPVYNEAQQINLPKVGLIKCVISKECRRMPKSITVTKTPSGKYFALCLVEELGELPVKPEPVESKATGIDLGIKSFAVLSNGEVIDNPKFLSKSLKALRRVHRGHSKKKKGSKNRERSRKKLARLHEKVANQRKDFLHKVTTRLVRENQTVCIEDLNVEGMSKNRKLARHIQDAGWSEFRRQLTYKADWYGINIKIISRFSPSSRLCTCGVKNEELTLKQRSWTCAACGATHDRDLLAAQNIVRFAFHTETVVKKKIGRGTPKFTPVETLALAGH